MDAIANNALLKQWEFFTLNPECWQTQNQLSTYSHKSPVISSLLWASTLTQMWTQHFGKQMILYQSGFQ
jgi:hypothetical protein